MLWDTPQDMAWARGKPISVALSVGTGVCLCVCVPKLSFYLFVHATNLDTQLGLGI